MKKLIILALLLTLQFSAFPQDGNFSHPWKGATVAFFGDSITDPGSVTPISGVIFRNGWESSLWFMVSVAGSGMMCPIRPTS